MGAGENHELHLEVEAGGAGLQGDLVLPKAPRGLVVFAHGAGSSRFSPRNRLVASRLRALGLATLLMDLLTPEEERRRTPVFDVELLAGRLLAARSLLENHPSTSRLPLAYFGASTGAAAALAADAISPGARAIVSRGGRPDLASRWLPEVKAPTLLIVGGLDKVVLELNKEAMARMACPVELRVVPGAGHLFEEPGALEQVAEAAGEWFRHHFCLG